MYAQAGVDSGAGPTEKPATSTQLERVEITGSRRELDERAESVTTRIVVGRGEILQFGDRSVTDVLKRLPGVTVTSSANGSEIRMRGLGTGYTQVLVNGSPTPQGFSIDSISPETIERIEVVRAATAETGTQAIAGTINIVLKQAPTKPQAELKASAGTENSQPSYGMSATLGSKAGDFSYALVATADHRETKQFTDLLWGGTDSTGATSLQRTGYRDYRYTIDSVSIVPRATWKLSEGDTLSGDARLSRTQTNGVQLERIVTVLGELLPYTRTDLDVNAPVTSLHGNLLWARSLDSGATLNAKLGMGLDRKVSLANVNGFDQAGTFDLQRRVTSRAEDKSVDSTGKYAAPLTEEHDFSVGWDGTFARRNEDRIQSDIFPQGGDPVDINESYDARVERLALYAQDEWKASSQLSGYLGLRWEGLRTTSLGNVIAAVQNTSSTLSPLLQTVWQVPGTKSDRVRIALTRTYKAPLTSDLMPRRFVAKNNTAVTPNYQGNADLRPELAWGLDAAYEVTFTNAATLNISAYGRSIDNVIRLELYEQDGVWINRPINGGRAMSSGVEIDGKTPIPAPFGGLTLKGNLGLNWSTVYDVPGPDNRLDQQVPVTANIGIEYARPDSGVSAGGSIGYQRGARTRISSTSWAQSGSSRALDLYGLWRFQPGAALRLSATNLFALRTFARTAYQDGPASQYLDTFDDLKPRIRLALEWKL